MVNVDIEDDDWLYRRLHPYCFKKNGALSSAAFKTNGFPDCEISVDLAKLTTPFESVHRAGKPGFRLGQLQAGGPRRLGFDVIHDPLRFTERPECDNEPHSLIKGMNTPELCHELVKLVTLVEGLQS